MNYLTFCNLCVSLLIITSGSNADKKSLTVMDGVEECAGNSKEIYTKHYERLYK